MTMVILPIGENVLIEPIEQDRTFGDGAFILPENVENEKPTMGRVIAVGTGHLVQGVGWIPSELFAGAMVLFNKYAGREAEYEGKKYMVLRESDVYGMVLPEEQFIEMVAQEPDAFLDRTLLSRSELYDIAEEEFVGNINAVPENLISLDESTMTDVGDGDETRTEEAGDGEGNGGAPLSSNVDSLNGNH